MLIELARQDIKDFSLEKKSRVSAGDIVNFPKNINFFVNYLNPYLISEDIRQLLLSNFVSPA